jgi:dihydroorotase
MLTRRAFLRSSAVAVAAGLHPSTDARGALSHVEGPTRSLSAAKYDVLVVGGRVVDPANRIDRVMDLGISGGRITALQPKLSMADAAETINAGGKLVVPGLIDIHTHARSMEMPSICLSNGVTSLVDAGSQGSDAVEEVVAVAKAAPNRVRILINIAKTGILPDGELMDLGRVDVDATRKAIERHRDVIVGIKARLSRTVAGSNDLEALKRAQAVATPLKVPVMIHIGDTMSPLPAILGLLKPGDIVTHVYAPPPHGIFDDKGAVLPEVIAARKRGIWFDIGNGRVGHITWNVAEDALRKGFPPDTVSSDWTDAGRTDQVFDFPNVLSKFLLLGMPVDQILARGTVNAAKTIPGWSGLGTLRVGAPADVTVLELRDGAFEFVDNANTKRTGKQKLFASATIFGGKRMTV